MNRQRQLAPTRPIMGSFPLDHGGECKMEMQDFLDCINVYKKHSKCREETKIYLACRMDRNLMAREKLEDIGFGDTALVVPPKAPERIQGGEFIPGLDEASVAKKKAKKTSIFGL